jgi:signal transduction histidine kinase
MSVSVPARTANGPRSPLLAVRGTVLGPRRASLSPVLALASLCLAALTALEVVLLAADGRGALWPFVLFPAVAAVYFLAGITAASRREGNRFGALVMLGGLTILAAGLEGVAEPPLVGFGFVCALVPFAAIVHLMLAFPSGFLRSRAEKALVCATYAAMLILLAPAWLWGQGPEPWAPGLAAGDRPDLSSLGALVRDSVGGALLLVASAFLVRHHRTATAAQRRTLGPLYIYGAFTWFFILLSARILPHLLDPEALSIAQLLIVGGVPVAFAITVRRGGFAQTSDLDQLAAWEAMRAGGTAGLTGALATALGDPSVRLAVWDREAAGYVDERGRPVDPGASADRRVDIELAGRPVGAIFYDGTTIGDPAVVRAAGRTVALALDHERLTAELSASHDHLRDSRARLADAADGERRRIARDLHDGIQGRLVVLGVEIDGLARDGEVPAAARAEASAVRRRLDEVARELGDLVQGLAPAGLVENGLAEAIEDLADRMPVPVTLAIEAGDREAIAAVPAAVAPAAYFVVAEALANAIKHAGPVALAVAVACHGGTLRVAVRDDGAGGAQPGRGAGLRNMADRLEVVGGALRVESPAGAGTTVTGEIPCEW